jgi:hypothetical protein
MRGTSRDGRYGVFAFPLVAAVADSIQVNTCALLPEEFNANTGRFVVDYRRRHL